jgi:diguanylate cyclase (GGDEF)-like protein
MSRTSASVLTAIDALGVAVADARASGTAVALAFVDVNDFRRVRDSLGSDLGEELLTQLSARLRSAVRPADLVEREGQSFLVLLRDLPIDARLHAEAVGQRITDAMHAPFALGAAELLVEVSVGISIFPDDAETPESLRKHADAAMYEARAAGGGVHIYGLGTADPLERLELAARLRRAIERGELELHHQPIMRLADGAVIGVESLVRWRAASPRS